METSGNSAGKDGAASIVEPICVRVGEACRLTGIGRSKFYELIASGDIKVVKVGAMTLVPYDELRGFINRAGG